VAVEDRVDLIRAGGRLVHALRVDRDDFLRASPEGAEGGKLCLAEPGDGGVITSSCIKSGVKAVGISEKIRVERVCVCEMHQQVIEQGHVAAGLKREVQISLVTTGGAARVDDDQLCAARAFCGQNALVQDRMAPCEV